MKKLSIREVEYIAYRLTRELMPFDEPLPEFTTRYPGKLESCLEQPFQTFDNDELYPTIIDKSSLLFYLIIKNHPFANGNKRMAVTTTFVFLFKNGYWLTINPDDLYKIALSVARSRAKERSLSILNNFFQDLLVGLKDS